MHPAPQYLRGLHIPTRFAVIRPLYDGEGSDFRARYRAQFLDELAAAPPRWWLVPAPALLAQEDELRSHRIESFPEALALLRAGYRAAGKTTEWVIYERRSDGSGT
jgi:hypothetical protein